MNASRVSTLVLLSVVLGCQRTPRLQIIDCDGPLQVSSFVTSEPVLSGQIEVNAWQNSQIELRSKEHARVTIRVDDGYLRPSRANSDAVEKVELYMRSRTLKEVVDTVPQLLGVLGIHSEDCDKRWYLWSADSEWNRENGRDRLLLQHPFNESVGRFDVVEINKAIGESDRWDIRITFGDHAAPIQGKPR